VPHPVGAGGGRPPPATRPRAAATTGRPLPARVRLQGERPELVDAENHVRIAVQDIVGAVHQPVQVQNAVLLGLEVGIGALLPGLEALKRHALLVEQDPQALVAAVVDHPSATRKSASLLRLQVAKGSL
jgi:hypothetical protein